MDSDQLLLERMSRDDLLTFRCALPPHFTQPQREYRPLVVSPASVLAVFSRSIAESSSGESKDSSDARAALPDEAPDMAFPASQTSLSRGQYVGDIRSHSVYSVEEDKQKRASDARRRAADVQKDRMRRAIAELRGRFSKLRERMGEESAVHPLRAALTPAELILDSALQWQLELEGEARVSHVDVEWRYELERRRVLLKKFIARYLCDLEAEGEEALVSGIGDRQLRVAVVRTQTLSAALVAAQSELVASYSKHPEKARMALREAEALNVGVPQGQALALAAEEVAMTAPAEGDSHSESGSGSSTPVAADDKPVESARSEALASSTEGAAHGSFEERRSMRLARKAKLEAIAAERPGPDEDFPPDAEAIRIAKEYRGDYRLKTSKEYRPGKDGRRVDVAGKTIQMVETELACHALRQGFNKRVLALRIRKQNILAALAAAELEIASIDAELHHGATVRAIVEAGSALPLHLLQRMPSLPLHTMEALDVYMKALQVAEHDAADVDWVALMKAQETESLAQLGRRFTKILASKGHYVTSSTGEAYPWGQHDDYSGKFGTYPFRLLDPHAALLQRHLSPQAGVAEEAPATDSKTKDPSVSTGFHRFRVTESMSGVTLLREDIPSLYAESLNDEALYAAKKAEYDELLRVYDAEMADRRAVLDAFEQSKAEAEAILEAGGVPAQRPEEMEPPNLPNLPQLPHEPHQPASRISELAPLAVSSPVSLEEVAEAKARFHLLLSRKSWLRTQEQLMITSFDAAVSSLHKERARVQAVGLSSALRLLSLKQELALLRDMAKRDAVLDARLAKANSDKEAISTQIGAFTTHMNEKKAELVQLQAKERQLLVELEESLHGGATNPAYPALMRLFKKKIKRKSGNDDDDDDSDLDDDLEDLDDLDDEEEDEGPEGPPDGCDRATYERMVALREQRLDIDELISETNKAIDEQKRSIDRAHIKEKGIDKELTSCVADLEAFQKEKQARLNLVDGIVCLRASQLLCGTQPPHFQPTHSQASTPQDSEHPLGTLPSSVDNCVTFSRPQLRGLKARTSKLTAEISRLQAYLRALRREEKQLAAEKKRLEATIKEYRANADEIQMLKFGCVLDLSALDKATAGSTAAVAHVIQEQAQLDAEQKAELEAMRKHMHKLQEELLVLTGKHTVLLEDMAALTAKQNQLEAALSGRPDKAADATTLALLLGINMPGSDPLAASTGGSAGGKRGLASTSKSATGKLPETDAGPGDTTTSTNVPRGSGRAGAASLRSSAAIAGLAKTLGAAPHAKVLTSSSGAAQPKALTAMSGQSMVVMSDPAAIEKKQNEERAKLSAIVQNQAREIEAMRAEISLLRRQATVLGPAYTGLGPMPTTHSRKPSMSSPHDDHQLFDPDNFGDDEDFGVVGMQHNQLVLDVTAGTAHGSISPGKAAPVSPAGIVPRQRTPSLPTRSTSAQPQPAAQKTSTNVHNSGAEMGDDNDVSPFHADVPDAPLNLDSSRPSTAG
jgi:hypothetical protein